jgi:hypothetical protein
MAAVRPGEASGSRKARRPWQDRRKLGEAEARVAQFLAVLLMAFVAAKP